MVHSPRFTVHRIKNVIPAKLVLAKAGSRNGDKMIGKMRILPTVSPPLRWGRLRGGTCQLVSFLTYQLK